MSEDAGALTPTEHGRLLAAAVQGVAWALIEYETDTSDRGVTEDHYRDAVRRAEAILPALVPRSTAQDHPNRTQEES